MVVNELKFQKEFQFSILETIYENSWTGSSFFKAFDLKEKREVGIKVIENINEKNFSIIREEAIVLQKINRITHNTPEVYMTYYDKNKNKFYIFMELIKGTTFRHLLNNQLNQEVAIKYLISLCEILIPIHKNGYQHRDIKPENILIGNNSKVYLIDFNLTAAIPRKGEGTRQYISPEMGEYYSIISSENVDIFSIGVILYEVLTGKCPVFGIDYACDSNSTDWDLFIPPIEKSPSIPKRLNDITMKCMHLNPKKRYLSASALKYDLTLKR